MTSAPPPIRNTGLTKSVDTETQVDYLMLKVDRHSTVLKILKWSVCTAIVFALGAIGAVGTGIYSRGVMDQTMRNGIERCQRDADDFRSDIRELQRIVYGRRGSVIPHQLEDKQ